MGAILVRPVTRTAKGAHHRRSDPGWQRKPGYRTPSKEELKRIRDKELKREEEQRKQKEASEKGVLERIIDWLLRRN